MKTSDWLHGNCKFSQTKRMPWDVELWPNMDENWRREKINSIIQYAKDDWGKGDPYNYERDIRQLAAGNIGFWEELVDEYSQYYGLTPADFKTVVDQLDALAQSRQPEVQPVANQPSTSAIQNTHMAWTLSNCKFADWGHGDTLHGQMMKRTFTRVSLQVDELRRRASQNNFEDVLPRWRGEVKQMILRLPTMASIEKYSMCQLQELEKQLEEVSKYMKRYDRKRFWEIVGDAD